MEARVNKTYNITYLIVSQDLFYKAGTLNMISQKDPSIQSLSLLILPCENVLGNTRICSLGAYRLIIRTNSKDNLDVKLYYESYEAKIKDVIIEDPDGNNYIYHLSPSGVIVYLSLTDAFVFSEDNGDSSLIQLFVYENQTNLKKVWENGFVKVYRI